MLPKCTPKCILLALSRAKHRDEQRVVPCRDRLWRQKQRGPRNAATKHDAVLRSLVDLGASRQRRFATGGRFPTCPTRNSSQVDKKSRCCNSEQQRRKSLMTVERA